MALNFHHQSGPNEANDLVVLLHGFGGCAAQWRGLQRFLSPYASSMAFDLPGHAGSLNSGVSPSPKAAAEAILQMLEGRSERLHIVGHSMGGAIASLMGILAPERIATLTLLAPGGFGPQIAHDTLIEWAKARSKAELMAVMPNFFASTYQIDPRIIELQEKLRADDSASQSLQSIASRLAKDGVQGMLPVSDLFVTDVAVSVIWGSDDRILPVSHVESLQPWVDAGRCDLHVVEGMGHSPAEEAPELVRETIISQLNRQPKK